MISESTTQAALVKWLKSHGIFFTHVPNETQLQSERNTKVRLGMLVGVPDLLIFDPPPELPGFHGTAIEMKSATGRLSAEQTRVQEMFARRQWYVFTARSYDEAVGTLMDLGYARSLTQG
jgi:hypothetical protein